MGLNWRRATAKGTRRTRKKATYQVSLTPRRTNPGKKTQREKGGHRSETSGGTPWAKSGTNKKKKSGFKVRGGAGKRKGVKKRATIRWE